MSDNTTITPGVGETFATDDISSVKYPRIKLIHGADGTNDGDVSIANGLPVQVVAALPAGTNAIGKLSANSGVDIGDVDITSIAAGDNNIGNVDVVTVPADPFGANADAAATAGSTGSIQAKLRLITSQLDSIKTAVETLDNVVGGSEAQVDVVGALPAGNNNIGDVDIASIAAGDNNIGNVDIASIAAGDNNIGNVDIASAIPAGTNNIGDVDVLTLPSPISGPGNPTIDSYASVAINLTTGADQVLVASAASKQIWVYGYGFTVGDADGQTVSLQDQDDAALTGIMEFARYGGISVPPSGNFSMPIFKLGTDKDLEIDITGGDVDGFICYAIVSV